MRKGITSEEAAKSIAHQIVEGLYALHEDLNIIHRDIKPENILCNENVYKITDFGLSIQKSTFQSGSGTLLYMAPELLMDGEKGKGVDIWSFGIILYEMLFKQHPFRADG